MAWYVYDKNGYVDQMMTYGGLKDIMGRNLKNLNEFISNGEADEELRRMILSELEDTVKDAELLSVYDLILRSKAPILLTDGGCDERIEKFHDESEYAEPIPLDDGTYEIPE